MHLFKMKVFVPDTKLINLPNLQTKYKFHPRKQAAAPWLYDYMKGFLAEHLFLNSLPKGWLSFSFSLTIKPCPRSCWSCQAAYLFSRGTCGSSHKADGSVDDLFPLDHDFIYFVG